jgi:hypothetical protein
MGSRIWTRCGPVSPLRGTLRQREGLHGGRGRAAVRSGNGSRLVVGGGRECARGYFGASAAQQEIAARLNIERLERIYEAVQIPPVRHGGSGIKKKYIQEAIHRGIAKINIGIALRQPYEVAIKESQEPAKKAVYDAAVHVLTEELELRGSRRLINPQA